jgi:hypothetical protein
MSLLASPRARVVALILAGTCLLGADFSRPDPASFTLGTTTEVQIRQRFGPPYGQSTAEVGGRQVTTLQYTYAEMRSTVVPVRVMTYTFHEGRLVGFDYSSSFVVDETAFDESVAKKIKRGETTRAEVLALAGRPTGQFIYQFVPGDVGPDGVVVDHLTELYVQGKVTYVYDGATGATLAITVLGTTTEICAALS